MRSVDDAEEWLDSWVASVDGRAARAVELSRRVATLTGEARSPDGFVSVTVGATGQITGLDIDDRARVLTGAALSREILSLVRRAQAQLSVKAAEQVRETVGVDTETGRAVMHSYAERFPAPDDGDLNDEQRDRHGR
ncbi:YbaB/EbfC family nucleoid-associated protein [Couchioplanes caeruleus]|uniref:YbaB/EbfC family nucleoid-associated protein n=1 Tax=Couchioplanes caeruleus TaxID=56438 RepID=UPI0020BFF975|nr:YbaB/EbfC family nucleoid-associated protein [Couchioplanes caeruleus]UQU67767.1 YbaB/EbfC family nucleoid-associated protein [Couchioplanes caeruleus]